MIIKLKYIGVQWWDAEHTKGDRLWNIIAEGHPFHQSTRTLQGLRELGII